MQFSVKQKRRDSFSKLPFNLLIQIFELLEKMTWASKPIIITASLSYAPSHPQIQTQRHGFCKLVKHLRKLIHLPTWIIKGLNASVAGKADY